MGRGEARAQGGGDGVGGVDGDQRLDGEVGGFAIVGVDQERGAIAELALHDGEGGAVALAWLGGDAESTLPAGGAFLEGLCAVGPA